MIKLIIWAIGTAVTGFTLLHGLPYLLRYFIVEVLAKPDREWFFVRRQEGHILTVVQNPQKDPQKVLNSGGFVKHILCFTNHILLDSKEKLEDFRTTFSSQTARLWDVVWMKPDDPTCQAFAARWKQPWWENFWGVTWIGLPPFNKIYQYELEFMTPKQQRNEEKTVIEKHPKCRLRTILAKKITYVFLVNNAEIKEKAKINMTVFFTWSCANPYIALFGVQNWLESSIAKMQTALRTIVCEMEYGELLKKTGRGSQKDDFQKIGEVVDVLTECLDLYGIKVHELYVVDVELTGDSRKFFDATQAKAIAIQEADAAEERARGAAANISKQAAAIRANGPAGTTDALGIALRESQLKVLALGDTTGGLLAGALANEQPEPTDANQRPTNPPAQ